ncbi:Sterile alpha motif type 2 [Penicillium expansum]|nr:Sterile alpha motif type 2 [Penicillium expansum]
MASHIIGNRNSTPEASNSTLRPPSSSRNLGSHQLRASADMSGFPSPLSARSIRPSSEVFFNQQTQGQNATEDALDRAAQQWLADIDQYETTLEEMAAATLDQDFKDELSAIEQWFRVLSEAERTAALYALLQQTTQVQIRFFIQVLQQMSQGHPMSGLLSLPTLAKRLNMDTSSRNSLGRPPPSPGAKRNSVLDPSTINAMFPDAAAAIAKKKAEFTQQTGNAPPLNRNSAVFDRASFVAPTISAPDNNSDGLGSTAWLSPTGQFSQPSGMRSPLPQTANIPAPDIEPPLLSPYNVGNHSWASMTNTPMTATFGQQSHQNPNTHADMVANATAMKLAALSTVNNRIALDDARKYRRARSNDGQGKNSHGNPMLSQGLASPGLGGQHLVAGQLLNTQQLAALQAQQQAAMAGRRSRPTSPGIAMHGGGLTPMGFTSPQNNGFLAAYDPNNPLMGNGLGSLNIGQFGYARPLSAGSPWQLEAAQDPTDPALLKDIPSWLRSLRLHKYTDNLKDLQWTELVDLDDKALEDRGVNALGARNKMLKVFEQVKEARVDGKFENLV